MIEICIPGKDPIQVKSDDRKYAEKKAIELANYYEGCVRIKLYKDKKLLSTLIRIDIHAKKDDWPHWVSVTGRDYGGVL